MRVQQLPSMFRVCTMARYLRSRPLGISSYICQLRRDGSKDASLLEALLIQRPLHYLEFVSFVVSCIQ